MTEYSIKSCPTSFLKTEQTPIWQLCSEYWTEIPCLSLQMLAQVTQITPVGLVVRYFATFPVPALAPKMSLILLLPSPSQVQLPKDYGLSVCGLATWKLVTNKYCTVHSQYRGWETWRGVEEPEVPQRFVWPLCLLFSLWLIFSLCIYRQLTPGTPSLWHCIPSVFHGSLTRLIQRSKARKTLSLWASWISLASRTFRSGFCFLWGGLVLEMLMHIGRNFDVFASW